MQPVRVWFVFELPAVIKKKGEYYISCCPVLDVYSQGETKGKALKNLTQALRLFFVSCFERGTLDDVLRECGFQAIAKTIVRERSPSKKYTSVKVPLPFRTPRKFDSSLCRV